jgi:hypothetical protein
MKLSTNVSLRAEDKDRYQFLYATQLYDTFYGVYGKFFCRPNPNDPESVFLDRIDFIGINYKGPSTLKIYEQSDLTGHIHVKDEPVIYDENLPKMIKIDLWLQADSGSPNALLDEPHIDFTKYPIVNKDYSVKTGDYLRIERKLMPMNPDTTVHDREQAFVNGHFDGEFWERDGISFKKKKEDALTVDFSNSSVSHDNDFDKEKELKLMAPSINCVPSMINLII